MERVLLIAEQPELIQSFTELLSSVYEVSSVTSEQEAVEILRQDYTSVVAVLMELALVRRGGFAFPSLMPSQSSLLSVPVIAISSAPPSEADATCLEHGFSDFVCTSLPSALLLRRIANAIRAQDSLTLGEVEGMLKQLPSCIFLKDAEGRYVFSTQYWRHLNTEGDPNWTIRGKTDLDIRKDKENAKKAMEADRAIIQTGKGTDYVIEENQDGIKEYLQLIKRPLFDENGDVNGIIALINNITDYQLLKLELERRVKTDDHMITAMSADYRSIYYADLDKDECLCVRAYLQDDYMWEGRTFAFVVGFEDYAQRYVVEDDREAFLEFVSPEAIRAGLADEAMISHRYLSTRSGKEKYEMLRIAGVRHIKDRDDHTVHAIAAGFSDVDRQMREQLEHNRALTEALARAEEASIAKTAFLSSMSHEMRTPMNAIIGLDNIALHDPSISQETREELEKIGASARHLLSLINDILDMSRIEAGRMELKQNEFSLGDLLDQVGTIIKGQCDDKGLDFVLNKVGTHGELFVGDDLRLKQIIINILGNSVKFTDAPGTVSFTVEQLGSAEREGLPDGCQLVRFTMEDTGVGMSREFLPKLFEPFCQEDATTTNRYGGSGLGMAITKKMVDLMGGTIEVKSEKGRGTTFAVSIPLQPVVCDEVEEAAEEADADVASIEGLNVLIVEDVEINAEVLAVLLEMEDVTSDWAENGQIAVEMFCGSADGQYAAVLMDMRMPVMDGLTAAREIRKLDRPDAKRVPIVALTANAFEDDVKACLDAGMDAHLSKPVDMDLLKKVLGGLLAKQ